MPKKARRPTPAVRVAGCSCHRMMRVLKKLGGTAPEENVLDHFAEEELLVAPLLPMSVARQLFAQHAYFRKQLELYGDVDPVEFKKHAQWEDETMARYFPND